MFVACCLCIICRTNPVNLFINSVLSIKHKPVKPLNIFSRVCTSQHLWDLQWIASIAIMFWICYILFFIAKPQTDYEFEILSGITAAVVAALNWTYQTGSCRLGSIDLFGCEISVICRVCLVVDFGRASIEPLNLSLHDAAGTIPGDSSAGDRLKFTSEEHYTPVYDGNLSDLRPLDADVVNHVTEFYTYRKTMLDYLRKIASAPSEAHAKLTMQMIYMQFLMYESGRKAILRLIEFYPNKADGLEPVLNFCRIDS
jgi:hypothetical protein